MTKYIKNQFFITLVMLALTNICSAQTETNVPQDSLPAAAHNELHKKYVAYAVISIIKITDKQQKITYKVEVQKKTTSIELHYDKEGNLISKEKSKIYSFVGTEKIKPKSVPSKSNDSQGGHQH